MNAVAISNCIFFPYEFGMIIEIIKEALWYFYKSQLFKAKIELDKFLNVYICKCK